MADKDGGYIWGTGRRKTAVARVRIKSGSGKIFVNKRDIEEYFPTVSQRSTVRAPLTALDQNASVDVFVNVKGGGNVAQAGAISLGLARALCKRNSDDEPTLREQNFMTRDSRSKERKKYGRAGARKSFQFSKR